MAAFVDRVVVHVSAGNGGHGVASIHREKFKPLGGPDGGNGGDGGDVVLEVDPSVHTLLDFHHHPHQKAPNGKPGGGSNRNGARGEDAVLRVPEGTVVTTADGELLLFSILCNNYTVPTRQVDRVADALAVRMASLRLTPGGATAGGR